MTTITATQVEHVVTGRVIEMEKATTNENMGTPPDEMYPMEPLPRRDTADLELVVESEHEKKSTLFWTSLLCQCKCADEVKDVSADYDKEEVTAVDLEEKVTCTEDDHEQKVI